MVFGDSNSWGWSPREEIVPVQRYDDDVRWTGVMAAELGEGFEVINESLSARTAATSDDSLGIEGAGLNGLEYFPAALASQMPLDLVIIMLGTNDTKPQFGLSTQDISEDIMKLVAEAQSNTGVATSYDPARVLVVVPPALGNIANVDWVQAMFPPESVTKSQELAGVLCPMADAENIPCFDGGSVAEITGADGIHMTKENHAALGKAVAVEVQSILQ